MKLRRGGFPKKKLFVSCQPFNCRPTGRMCELLIQQKSKRAALLVVARVLNSLED